MTNIEKLEEVGILEEVRKRVGAESGEDTTYDDEINELNNEELVGKWTGWKLGSEEWAHTVIGYYNHLNELTEPNTKTDEKA